MARRHSYVCPGCRRPIALPAGVDVATAAAADRVCHACDVNDPKVWREEMFRRAAESTPASRERDNREYEEGLAMMMAAEEEAQAEHDAMMAAAEETECAS